MIYKFETVDSNSFTVDYEGVKVLWRFELLNALGGLNTFIDNILYGTADGSDDPNEGDPNAEFVGCEEVQQAYTKWLESQPDEPPGLY